MANKRNTPGVTGQDEEYKLESGDRQNHATPQDDQKYQKQTRAYEYYKSAERQLVDAEVLALERTRPEYAVKQVDLALTIEYDQK